MELKEGARYVRRDGTVTDPLVLNDEGFLHDEDAGLNYDPQDSDYGHYVWGDTSLDQEEDPCDLIKIYLEN